MSRRPAALAALLSPDRKQILLVKRRDVPVWVLPGGGIDPGETPEAAAVREFFEETGIRVNLIRKVAEYVPLNKLASPAHFFECQRIDGAARLTCETSAIAFFPLNALPKSLFIVHRDWIEDLENLNVVTKPIWRVTYWELLKYFVRHPILLLSYLFKKNKGHE
jgi:8-oxo-dGTP diphosphatase